MIKEIITIDQYNKHEDWINKTENMNYISILTGLEHNFNLNPNIVLVSVDRLPTTTDVEALPWLLTLVLAWYKQHIK